MRVWLPTKRPLCSSLQKLALYDSGHQHSTMELLNRLQYRAELCKPKSWLAEIDVKTTQDQFTGILPCFWTPLDGLEQRNSLTKEHSHQLFQFEGLVVIFKMSSEHIGPLEIMNQKHQCTSIDLAWHPFQLPRNIIPARKDILWKNSRWVRIR